VLIKKYVYEESLFYLFADKVWSGMPAYGKGLADVPASASRLPKLITKVE